MFVTNWISTTKIQKISEITNFFRHYFLSRTEVNIALDMGIDNHLQFSEDEAGTRAMFARENRARERYNKCRAMDCKMEAGSYFEEK